MLVFGRRGLGKAKEPQMTPGLGVVVFIALPLVVQLAAYFGLGRLAFQLPTGRALGIAVARVVIGVMLFLACFPLVDTIGAGLLISSPIAWLVIAFMDPRRSIRRAIAWVLVGTALTLAVNESCWRLMIGESVLSMNTRWSFG